MTLHQLITKWPRVFGIFFGLTVIAASSLLTGCSAAEDRLEEGPGIYQCVSNAGRPVLTFDSKTLKVSTVAYGSLSRISVYQHRYSATSRSVRQRRPRLYV